MGKVIYVDFEYRSAEAELKRKYAGSGMSFGQMIEAEIAEGYRDWLGDQKPNVKWDPFEGL